jgi:site-specific DNA recombinase
MRAFGYVRLSKDVEGTTSPQRQREAIERLCADRGWELVKTFEDIDVSAFNGKHRPGFMAMMDRLDETDALVFWRLDRLSRSTVEAGQIAEQCKAAAVNLVATDMDIDTTTAGGKWWPA